MESSGKRCGGILWIFGKEFAGLIAIAFIIAAPFACWLMNTWLEDFQYRIPIELWIFVIAIVMIVVVATITVGYQSIRAALMNLVKSVRAE